MTSVNIMNIYQNYFGLPLPADTVFNTELVSKVIFNLKCGRALDANRHTAEHLIRAHPILPVVLSKLFKLILLCKQVPAGFGHSYIVPLPKLKDCITKVRLCAWRCGWGEVHVVCAMSWRRFWYCLKIYFHGVTTCHFEIIKSTRVT